MSGTDLWGESIPGRGNGECQGPREGHVWCVHGPVRTNGGLEGREQRSERKGKRAKGGQRLFGATVKTLGFS